MKSTLHLLLADILNVSQDEIIDDLTMQTTDSWDSLKHMELITAIESAFKIELSFDEIISMQSIGQIKKILSSKGMDI